jgi:transcriptional regulator with XRE-family HTH domain
MSRTKKYSASVPLDVVLAKHKKTPEFRRAYEELEPEFAIIRQIIDLRLKRKMTQAQLAKRIGTAQPSIARLESRGKVKNLDYLRRIARALDADVEVRFIPRENRRAARTADPDAGLKLRPEIAGGLLRQEREFAEGKRGKPWSQVKRELVSKG